MSARKAAEAAAEELGQLRTEYERLAAEFRRLRGQHAEAQRYLELSAAILVALNPDGTVAKLNERACELLGCEMSDALGADWFERFLPADSRVRTRAVFDQMIAGDIGTVEYFDNPVIGADGRARMIAWHNALVRDGTGRVLRTMSSGRDITERRDLEEQLRQSQKMEAVGRLAGGVAHDFNNLLTVIQGYSQLLLSELDDDDAAASVAEIEDAATRAEALTQQLLAFSRRQIMKPRAVNLNDVLADMQKMLRPLIGEDVEMVVRAADNLDLLKADPHHLEQVILNLVVNACEAMPDGGVLSIETSNVVIRASQSQRAEQIEAGRYVMFAVNDTGVGMDAETQSKIFEPFFTTKEKGTGLGLATVYGIVRQSGGYLGVASTIDNGSTFSVYLPCAGKDDVVETVAESDTSDVRGDETIMVVEDQDDVRGLICKTLRRHGYNVLDAVDGVSAITAVDAVEGQIDLILTDVVMPRMSGREMVDRLAPKYPSLKVLYMTGYTEDKVVHQGVIASKTKLIQKPFAPRALVRRIRQLLDRG